jgi:adenylate cyclase
MIRGNHPFRVPRGRRSAQSRRMPTFLFADLAGYSALTDERGDEMAAAVARQFADVMRVLTRKPGARHVQSLGDGVMIWSSDAARAVALAAEAIATTLPLPVRIGVHTGPAVRHRSDWYGSAVNVAARLADQAEPGEVLISGATRSAACCAAMHQLSACRELLLRGIDRPVIAWRLT